MFRQEILTEDLWIEVTTPAQIQQLLKFKNCKSPNYKGNWLEQQLANVHALHPEKAQGICFRLTTDKQGENEVGWNPKYHIVENTYGYYPNAKILTYNQALATAKRR